MRAFYLVLVILTIGLHASSLKPIPRWVIMSGCPDCDYCLILNGTVSPYWCVEDLAALPDFVRLSLGLPLDTTTMAPISASSSILGFLLVMIVVLNVIY
ncbi:hypothetical protein GCK72_012567 [Caenorhabditis remanei]|uniref:Uncharacterized protein n=1 Tax=Caenorhabditis remanei TaxID=31234 RepID=A0A6A5GN89_CAERE|nr:hypothetical protein GCK72_012567 [Caenorhabditis remanei]KAF1756114.1 hypothetical protein GCK72_012567 [Caenorhabditis remanei]